MQVFKFGGASIKDASAIKNVARILKEFADMPKVVVISAMGKTTNALEDIIRAYTENKSQAVYTLIDKLEYHHEQTIKTLFESNDKEAGRAVKQIFKDLRTFIKHNNSKNFYFIYDQIVSKGEFLSTTIVSHYLNSIGVVATWLDVRDVIHTDNAYTEARINWEQTESSISKIVPPLLKKGLVITQGFIGSTSERFTTTLGREGSDYSAAVFAYSLQAERLVIWKDVKGVLNADPRLFDDTIQLKRLSFKEAIEMTYYGAQVIHPKTIKPLQNRNISLQVRSFIDTALEGTIIGMQKDNSLSYPPIIVYKKQQILLSFSAKDFSFISEDSLSQIFDVFAKHRLRINMMQNKAISFTAVVDKKIGKVDLVVKELSSRFDITREEPLELLTIRHSTREKFLELTKGKCIVMRQRLVDTDQILMH